MSKKFKHVGEVIEPFILSTICKRYLLAGKGVAMDRFMKKYYEQHKSVCDYQYKSRYHNS